MHQDPDEADESARLAQGSRSTPSVDHLSSETNHALDNTVSNDSQTIEEERLKAYAHLLDSAIRLPGGFRIGLDGIVGLIPGVGDVLGAGLSGYFIYAASRLDIPRHVIARMMFNTALETVIGMIPVIGDAFDFVFKANDRNARLLHEALEARKAETHVNDNDNDSFIA